LFSRRREISKIVCVHSGCLLLGLLDAQGTHGNRSRDVLNGPAQIAKAGPFLNFFMFEIGLSLVSNPCRAYRAANPTLCILGCLKILPLAKSPFLEESSRPQ